MNNPNLNPRPSQGGYIALIALLIVASVGLTIGLALSIAGLDEIQVSFSNSQASKARILANGCIEDGLERLRNNWADYSGILSIGSNSCIINTVVAGSNATVTATGTVDIYNQKIQIQVDDALEVIVWQEE